MPFLAAVMLRHPHDAELAHRLKARDPNALAELYDRYGRIAFTLIFRIVRERGAAEDLVQESFLRIWNRASGFDPERGALGAWVLTVARNQALDYIRSVQGRVWNNVASADDEHPNTVSDWEEGILDAVRMRQVQSALGRLGEHQRTAIQLAYFEGLSQTEIAERMNQPLGTIKTWIRSALRTLRDELAVGAKA